MPTFPSEFQAVIYPYLGLFSRRVFAHVQLLVVGALLAPGKRTVTAALRIHLVKCRGVRWLSVCLLTPLPWAIRVWALPVRTVLAPSAGWAQAQGRRHQA